MKYITVAAESIDEFTKKLNNYPQYKLINFVRTQFQFIGIMEKTTY